MYVGLGHHKDMLSIVEKVDVGDSAVIVADIKTQEELFIPVGFPSTEELDISTVAKQHARSVDSIIQKI